MTEITWKRIRNAVKILISVSHAGNRRRGELKSVAANILTDTFLKLSSEFITFCFRYLSLKNENFKLVTQILIKN